MNVQQAKSLPLVEVLARMGSEAHHVAPNGDVWFLSPLRVETAPSMKINPQKNIWFDFGEGRGGNVLDLIMQYYRLPTVSDALRQLDDLYSTAPRVAAPAVTLPLFTAAAAAETSFTLKRIQPLQNKALIEYLRGRGIPFEVARSYVKEVYYDRDGKSYFALAFPNRTGGLELRNKYYKGVLGSKDISILPARSAAGETAAEIAIFEGFMDYLSAWVCREHTQIAVMTAIVMNSVALKAQTIEAVRTLGARTVNLFLDNDNAGRALTAELTHALHDCEVVDRPSLYSECKDFNEWLVKTTARQSNLLDV